GRPREGLGTRLRHRRPLAGASPYSVETTPAPIVAFSCIVLLELAPDRALPPPPRPPLRFASVTLNVQDVKLTVAPEPAALPPLGAALLLLRRRPRRALEPRRPT